MKVSVVGSGAWGTALAIRLHKNGHDVTMWTFETNLIEEMETTRRNPRLPGAVLPEGLKISGDYSCVRGCKLVVIASPSFPMRSVCRGVAPYIDKDAVVVSVTKGIEDGTCKRMSEIVGEETGKKVVVLTGPSHAEEVALNRLTYLTIGCTDLEKAQAFAKCMESHYVKTKVSQDVVGIEYASVLKNVYSIASGICHGLKYGDNFQAVLMSNALQEMQRLLTAVFPLDRSIIDSVYCGDLLVTGYSNFSRNRVFGTMIGKGYSVKSAQLEMEMIAEGFYGTKAIYEANQRIQVSLPIVDAMYEILYNRQKAKPIIKSLTTKLQ